MRRRDFELDGKYFIRVEAGDFGLMNSNKGKVYPEIDKETGEKHKKAGKPMSPSRLGSFSDVEALLKRYAFETVKNTKRKKAKAVELIDIYKDIFNKFNNLSIFLLNSSVKEALEKAKK